MDPHRGKAVVQRLGLAIVVAVLGCAFVSASAVASNQLTLDPNSDSFGAVVTDLAGNAYVTWNHRASPSDVPMFCRLAPGARHCTYESTLSLPGNPSDAAVVQPFVTVGPNGTVWVIASRYILQDTLIWTSSNGGRTFGAPYEIPYDPTPPCPAPCTDSYSYANQTAADDALPLNSDYVPYDPGKGAKVPRNLEWLESSWNPSLGFNFDETTETLGGPPGATEFTFGNTGSGRVGGSALGLAPLPGATAGDVVESYWRLTPTPALAYYYYAYSANSTFPISPQNGWSGPHSLGAGWLPRMADGVDGLFLISEDSPSGSGQPTAVQIRKYDPTSHSFTVLRTLVSTPGAGTDQFKGGGLAENLDTGEIVAVWPQINQTGPSSMMRLYLSSDGGRHFSVAQDIANIAIQYGNFDNARVAVAANGTGFVTFYDQRGLQIADLYPVAAQYGKLHTKKTGAHGTAVLVPVTCPAAQGRCVMSLSLRHGHGKNTRLLASKSFKLAGGKSKTLVVSLNHAGLQLLAAGHGHLKAVLTITERLSGAGVHTITAPTTVAH